MMLHFNTSLLVFLAKYCICDFPAVQSFGSYANTLSFLTKGRKTEPCLLAGRNWDQELSALPVTIADHAPSWENLWEGILATPTGRRLNKEACDREMGSGPPHTDAPFRLFTAKDESEIRVTFYRDDAAWCPYCQKVWLFLEEKCIPYRVRKVPLNAYGDKPSWYTRLVDGGKLPTLEIDGVLWKESLDIMKALEKIFSGYKPAMIPSDDGARKRMDGLLQLDKELQSAWFSLTFYPVEGEALIRAKEKFLDLLSKVDMELGISSGPWFLGGESPSVVDIQYITQMERIIASVLYWKGLTIRNTQFSNLDRWLTAFEKRPSYQSTKSDYYTLVMAIPSQNGPGYMVSEAKSFANQICGLSQGAWHLAQNPHLVGVPDSSSVEDNNPCHEAAYKLISNHVNVVQFACRGAGEPGSPSFHAELADPYAEPNLDYFQAVDVSLRHVAQALLEGATAHSSNSSVLQDLQGTGGNGELRDNWEAFPDEDNSSLTYYYYNWETGDSTWTAPTRQLDTCLMYLRDRIGVPRDMGPAAAMQLRAHLNWAIEVMK